MNNSNLQNNQQLNKIKKILATQQKQLQVLESMDPKTFNQSLNQNYNLPQQNIQTKQQNQTLKKRIRNLRESAQLRIAQIIPPIKLNTFMPLTAEQGRLLSQLLTQKKKVQQEKLKNTDLQELSKSYYKIYGQFKQNLKNNQNLVHDIGSEISNLNALTHILRNSKLTNELRIYQRQEPQTKQAQEIQAFYKKMKKKYDQKQPDDEIDVQSIILKGKKYLENIYKVEKEKI